MITISLSQSINASAEEVRTVLLEHDKLGRFFDGKFAIKQPQQCDSGAGLIREITMRGQKFCEEIVAVTKNCIHYRIIGTKPVNNHYGSIHFIDTGDGCQLNYFITCKAQWWQPSFIVQKVINQDISQGLMKLRDYFDGEAK
ncbi:SRPBCC family protein [Psychrobium sp. MM17-31]|uniref:SRPBCC family protein n=1 Tax=Psychrobium sp. MM17-31 TaxID=2917758 RepID=UPI001EF5AE22|nr:SRPBCC family protein [Psychrobium sp. MM17-31]MCG7532419.1 SRPBCC family protein [Psychrobium sp. MM17-31]